MPSHPSEPRAGPTSILHLELPSSLENTLAGGHPWIYRDHVPDRFSAAGGSWVRVCAGRFEAYALWDSRSPIALRVFARTQPPDAEWITERVRRAWSLRQRLRDVGQSAYRLVNGEGDGMPGVVVDVYADFAVLVTYADSLDVLVDSLTRAIEEVTGIRNVVRRTPGAGGLSQLSGRTPPKQVVVEENGLRMPVSLHDGQKTGLFLDQRDNRARVESFARGKTLNLFAYNGGFSLYAVRGGATRVTSVDSSTGALSDAREAFRLNGFDADEHEFEAADVFESLERRHSRSEEFDVVISDPPSFARNKSQLKTAKKAYVRLNAAGLRLCPAGGVYAAASCTAQLSPTEFHATLAESARRAKRRLQIFHEAGQPEDHPVMAGHPEGRYLKFVAARVLDLE